MKRTFDPSVEIDDYRVVSYDYLRRLARMLDLTTDDIRVAYNTVKHELGITTRVTKKIFNQNENRFFDALVEFIVDRALELGYDNDDTNFMSFYNFANGYQAGKVFNDEFMNMGYQPEIKHLGIPPAPKHLRQPTRYSDTEDYKRRQQMKLDDEFFKRRHLQPVSSINPWEERKHEALKKRFNERLDKERSQIVKLKETYKRMLD